MNVRGFGTHSKELAGPKHPGKAGRDIGWHGRQDGVVSLAERKLRVSKPRLRRKSKGKSSEVEIPAYAAMRTQSRVGQRILEILMRGVSTRNYKQVLPEMAETVNVSKSQISREFIEASEKALKGPRRSSRLPRSPTPSIIRRDADHDQRPGGEP